VVKLSRSDFIRHIALAVVGSSGFPRILFADPAETSRNPPNAALRSTRAEIDEFGIVDLHCHPSLKMYMWGKRLWRKYWPSSGTNPFALQVTVDQLRSGYVKGFLVAHYLVEAALTTESSKLRKLFPWIKLLLPELARKVEHQDSSNFTQVNIMIDEMESQVHRSNEEQHDLRLVIVRDFAEFEQAINDGNIPIAHAIEGAHALGKHLGDDSGPYIRNLEALKARGVCLMTIAHIFANDVAFPTEGISYDEKKKAGIDWKYDPIKSNQPLTAIGESVVRKMLDIGMIVDLTHSTPMTRQQVFKINVDRRKEGKHIRPLTFTHTGAQAVFSHYDHIYNEDQYDSFKYYDVCDEEIDQICECDGTIGVIPENFWLVSCDTHLNKSYASKFADGIQYIVETIAYINDKTRTRDFDNISIGTDFDGFADAPRDLFEASQLGALIQALRAYGLTDSHIKKITSLNALRLLRNGWTA
jgi:microsomal dipeptidase-like Zn-dependent dipeptidase